MHLGSDLCRIKQIKTDHVVPDPLVHARQAPLDRCQLVTRPDAGRLTDGAEAEEMRAQWKDRTRWCEGAPI